MERDKTILLIEDNPDDEALTIRALEKNNVANAVEVCRNGADALEYLFATGKHEDRDPNDLPMLVLLDLKLPKIDGIEVLRRVKNDERTKRVPVVILTSSREESDLAAGYDLGANSYISKPVDFEQFSEAVRNIGLYWLVLNQTPPKRRETSGD